MRPARGFSAGILYTTNRRSVSTVSRSADTKHVPAQGPRASTYGQIHLSIRVVCPIFPRTSPLHTACSLTCNRGRIPPRRGVSGLDTVSGEEAAAVVVPLYRPRSEREGGSGAHERKGDAPGVGWGGSERASEREGARSRSRERGSNNASVSQVQVVASSDAPEPRPAPPRPRG